MMRLSQKRPRFEDDAAVAALKCKNKRYCCALFHRLQNYIQTQFDLLNRILYPNLRQPINQLNQLNRLVILTLHQKLSIPFHIVTTSNCDVSNKNVLIMHTDIVRYVTARFVYETPYGLYKLAEWYYKCGDYKKAIEYFKKALAKGFLPAYSKAAWLLIIGRAGVSVDEEPMGTRC